MMKESKPDIVATKTIRNNGKLDHIEEIIIPFGWEGDITLELYHVPVDEKNFR